VGQAMRDRLPQSQSARMGIHKLSKSSPFLMFRDPWSIYMKPPNACCIIQKHCYNWLRARHCASAVGTHNELVVMRDSC